MVSHRMSSLNEEEADNYDESKTPPVIGQRNRTDFEVRLNNNNNITNSNKSCSERSDSGFSETCSSCTASHPCVCSQNAAASDKSASSGKSTDEIMAIGEVTAPLLNSNVLHRKLEEIALTQRCVKEEEIQTSTSRSVSPAFGGNRRTSLSRSFSSCSSELKAQFEKGPIMRSDFTNTITMRKQSLELHKQKEIHHQRPTVIVRVPSIDASGGKVSKLLERFNQQREPMPTESINGSSALPTIRSNQPIVSTATTNTIPRVSQLETRPSPRACKDFSSVRDRFNHHVADAGQTASSLLKQNSSHFNSNHHLTVHNESDKPTPTSTTAVAFSRSPLRLSGRIKEARDQLTKSTESSTGPNLRQHGDQKPTTSVISDNCQMSRSLMADRTRLNFEKASTFWKS